VQAEADAAQKQVAEKQAALNERRKSAMAEKKALEADFARLQAARPEAAKEVSPSLLARYEGIRERTGDTGMADLVKGKSCGGCGTLQPTRTIETLKEDKLATCESCRRILYYTEGVI
jgi:predicted  nucleic acid-binding Zn-ribbon protein